jgi:hypothetical protein
MDVVYEFPARACTSSMILILLCYRFRVRLRNTVLALGLPVILATFALGIHWLPDIVGGAAVGCGPQKQDPPATQPPSRAHIRDATRRVRISSPPGIREATGVCAGWAGPRRVKKLVEYRPSLLEYEFLRATALRGFGDYRDPQSQTKTGVA